MSTPAIPAAIDLAAAPAVSPASATVSPGACVSCGTALHGAFCHVCGERRMRPDELSLRTFARDVAAEVGDVDSRLVLSLRALVARPGFLTAEFLAGRRRMYVGPLKLFLLAFAALLVAETFVRRPMDEAVRELDGSRLGSGLAALAARLGTSEVQALERLQETTLSHSSWLSLLIPALMGALVALVFVRRRQGYVGHLVFSAHVASFYLLLTLALSPLQLLAHPGAEGVGALVGVALMGVLWLYLWRAAGRVYGTRGWRGGLVAVLLLAGYVVAQGVAGLLSLCTAALSLYYLG
jgi:hypothetical protein